MLDMTRSRRVATRAVGEEQSAYTHGAKRGCDDVQRSTRRLSLRYWDHGISVNSANLHLCYVYCTVPFTTTTTNPENSLSQPLMPNVSFMSAGTTNTYHRLVYHSPVALTHAEPTLSSHYAR
jgi:hypothetical protein